MFVVAATECTNPSLNYDAASAVRNSQFDKVLHPYLLLLCELRTELHLSRATVMWIPCYDNCALLGAASNLSLLPEGDWDVFHQTGFQELSWLLSALLFSSKNTPGKQREPCAQQGTLTMALHPESLTLQSVTLHLTCRGSVGELIQQHKVKAKTFFKSQGPLGST